MNSTTSEYAKLSKPTTNTVIIIEETPYTHKTARIYKYTKYSLIFTGTVLLILMLIFSLNDLDNQTPVEVEEKFAVIIEEAEITDAKQINMPKTEEEKTRQIFNMLKTENTEQEKRQAKQIFEIILT